MNLGTMTPPPMHEDGVTDRGDGKTALIVDDRPELQALIASWLTTLGYRIFTASDGKEAQGMMIEQGIANVDLLITDLDLSRMQGDELARWFVQEKPSARVLLMSGCLAGAKLPPGVVCLQKPFSREAFLARIADLIGSSGVRMVRPAFEYTFL